MTRHDLTVKSYKTVLFTICALLLVVLILELSARLMLPALEQKPKPPAAWVRVPEQIWTEFDARLGWFHKKNAEAHLLTKAIDQKLSTNSLGLRGRREYQKQKSEGITRFYLLGDSFAFGFGVADEETLTARIESSDPSVEAMNLGVAGYGIDQMKLLLEKFGFDYMPDLVFIAVYPEDFWRATRSYTDAGYAKPYYHLDRHGDLVLRNVPVPAPKSMTGTQFPEIDEQNIPLRLLQKSALVRLSLKLVTRVLKIAGLRDPDSSDDWRLGREVLKSMVADIREYRAEPVLVIVPPIRWITGQSEPLRESLINFAAREKMEILDLTDPFRKALNKAPAEHWYIPDDFHWTAAGHELAAEELLSFIHDWKKHD